MSGTFDGRIQSDEGVSGEENGGRGEGVQKGGLGLVHTWTRTV